jgi:hypothetical protein
MTGPPNNNPLIGLEKIIAARREKTINSDGAFRKRLNPTCSVLSIESL